MIQVQPQYINKYEWTVLSKQEGLSFETLEFCFESVRSDPMLFQSALEWYRQSGRVKSVHGAFIDINPASGDMEFNRLSRRRCEDSCALAVELGAGQVVLHSSAFPFLRGEYLISWADRCADFYMDLARRYSLGIRVENSWDVDPEPLAELMRRIQDADVAVCLDIGHANYSRAPIREWFDQLGESIAYLHLSDNMGRFDDHLPIGYGSIDWAQVDALWKRLNRNIPITLEVGGIEGVKQSIAFLRSNRFFGMEAHRHD